MNLITKTVSKDTGFETLFGADLQEAVEVLNCECVYNCDCDCYDCICDCDRSCDASK